MLLPDNIHPQHTIYYNGAFVLDTIRHHPLLDLLDLYMIARERCEMSMPVFVLSIDWLYLLGQVEIDGNGKVALCT